MYKDYSVRYQLISDQSECRDGDDPSNYQLSNPRSPWTYDVWNCADACRHKSTLFIFGTNDYGNNRCTSPKKSHPGKGCNCNCEVVADSEGKCEVSSYQSYRLYRIDNGIYNKGINQILCCN